MTEGRVPHHIAIVMDGNGRWATRRYLPRAAGHKKGYEALRRCLRHCGTRGVKVLTVFAFSSENWNRPVEEVSGLMDLLVSALARERSTLQQEGVRIRFVGERKGLSEKICAALEEAEAATASNSRLVFHVCFNYGGRWDIVQAAARLAYRLNCAEGLFTALHVGESDRMPALRYPEVPGWRWNKTAKSGHVIDVILEEALNVEADLIVMSTDGRDGFLDALRGSHSERVLRGSPCPLLAIPAVGIIAKVLEAEST